ncbi:MAG: class I SAM-dependent methyltransferase [Gemmatimonadota bacterium]|nr:MAG: class I SAM-dependent methyltransferase [Gemmatimonadota bacterium]
MKDSRLDRARVFGERDDGVERIAPGFFWPMIETQHLERYRWAARWVRHRSVLDVACGTGYGAEILQRAGARSVTSVDISRDALAFGLARYGTRGICADAQRLPFRPACFDTVVSLETIEHLSDATVFLRAVHRVLRPDGELLLSTPNAERSANDNPYHVRELSLDELERALSEVGFRLNRLWGQHWRLPWKVWHETWGLRRLAWEYEKRPKLIPWAPRGSQPLYWCAHVTRLDRPAGPREP